MQDLAQVLVAPGKGILAADESTGTIEKRFAAVGVESTETSRRDYRNMLFTTPGVEAFISGVILFDETMRQASDDGTPLPDLLTRRGIVPGVKVDRGTKALAGAPGEKVTEGLDGLRERLAEYRELGARFTKWRAVIGIGSNRPTDYAIRVNAHALARFAALSQEANLVPIVEPEVLMDGDHTVEKSFAATCRTLQAVFTELGAHGVQLEAMLLKPSMVLSGYECPEQATHEEVAEWTIRAMRRHVPAAVPGIVFLSGGQSDEDATGNLNALNRAAGQPWQLSFSFGRALQAAALKAWAGDLANMPAAQRVFARRVAETGAARSGTYSPLPRATATG
ncbi:MAG TPA: class I fructose-bisphosphate aldolase [Candidatus Limnocylindria bacterium]|nr:class I fructose-bisphosphate aldolase [Candidatus Limnocylindria bacterium]